MTIYTTAQDVHREIIEAIEGGDAKAAEFDLDQIAANCWKYRADEQGFTSTADTGEFWAQVEDAALTDFTARISPGDHEGTATATVYGFNGWEVDSWEVPAAESLEAIFRAAGYGITRVDGKDIAVHRQN